MSKYDVAVDQLAQDDTARVRSSVFGAAEANPDQAARAKQLGVKQGVPQPVAERNLPEVERRALIEDIDTLTRDDPVLRRFYGDPYKAKVGKDEAPALSQLTKAVRSFIDGGTTVTKKDSGPMVLRSQEFAARVKQVKEGNPALDWDTARSLAMQGVIIDNQSDLLREPARPDATAANIFRGIASSLPIGAEQTRQGIRRQLGDLFGFEDVSKDAAVKGARAANRAQAMRPEFTSTTAEGIYSGGESLVQNLPGLILSVATGSPIPGLAAIGMSTEAQAYNKYRDRGASGGLALLGAVGEGATEVITEVMPMGYIVKNLGRQGAGQFLTGLLGREVPTEQIATLVQDAIDTAVANPNKTWADYFAERPDAAYKTLVATVTQAGAMSAIGAVMNKAAVRAEQEDADAYAATAGAEQIKELVNIAQGLKLRERDPQTLAQLVKEVADDAGFDGNVYVEGRKLAEVVEAAGLTLEQFAEISSTAAGELIDAVQAGGVVTLPLEDLVANTKDTKLEQALLPHLRMTEDGLSQEEAAQVQQVAEQELQQRAQEIIQQASDTAAAQASHDAVKQIILDQLNSAGRFSKQVNELKATVAAASFTALGQRIGVSPEEMYQRYMLKVQSTLPDTETMGQTARTSKYRDTLLGGRKIEELSTGEREQYDAMTAEMYGLPPRVDVGGVQRAVVNSAGQPVATTEEGVRNFWKWFGDSKVVDAAGRPLVVYHGTSADFEAFSKKYAGSTTNAANADMGFFFTDRAGVAGVYARLGNGESPNVMPVYLSLRNPLRLTAPSMTAADTALTETMTDAYDSAVVAVGEGASKQNVHLVKDATQVKSAIGNDGGFDPQNASILRQGGQDQTDTPGFEKWSKGHPVVKLGESYDFRSGEGVVVEALHGTTGDFDTFDLSKANIESDLGGGFYFTNNPDDVGSNYAGFGPDLTSKIEREAERIASETDREYDDPDVRREARQKFVANEGLTMPVFVRFDNPVVLGGEGETFLTYEETYDEEFDEYGEPTGTLVDFVEALRNVASLFRDADADGAMADVWESVSDYGGIKVSELWEKLLSSDAMLDVADPETGALASREMVSRAFAQMGFDGFIDQTVNSKFGTDRSVGKPMEGMDENTVHFIAFNPDQVASRIGSTWERGDVGDSILKQSASEPLFYSALSKEITALPTKQATASGWLDALKGLEKNGKVKADEIEWTGIREWLGLQEGKITKEQVTAYLDANGVQVEEVTLVNREEVAYSVSESEDDDGNTEWWVYDSDGFREVAGPFYEEYEAQAEADRLTESVEQTKYQQYTLPGGQNYREVLLTLPTPAAKAQDRLRSANERLIKFLQEEKAFSRGGANGYALDAARGELTEGQLRFANSDPEQARLIKELVEAYAERNSSSGKSAQYKSSHWDQTNVLAHIRVNDRTDADGKRVLFVEEIQSDWGQDGKKKGFKQASPPQVSVSPNEDGAGFVVTRDGTAVWAGLSEEKANEVAAREKVKVQPGVPLAPFVTATDKWLTLALKRVVKMAVDEGYDRVAFVNGEQSADRYDLSKQLDEVLYDRKPNGGGEVIGRKDGGNAVVKAVATDEEVADVVGKDIAQKLLAAPVNDYGMHSLSGLDLKVGGEGMKAFYDKIVPNAVNALLKKLGGGKAESVALVLDDRSNLRGGWHLTPPEQTVSGKWMLKSSDYNSKGLLFDSEEEARAALAEKQPRNEQPGFTITDAMRETVNKGLPLFQENTTRGTFSVDTLTISLLEKADLSTFFHELGHFYLEVLTDISLRPDAPAEVVNDMNTLLAWFGVQDMPTWASMTLNQKRKYHEKFAESFEQYLFEGKAPSRELQGVFSRVAAWMKSVYKSIQLFLARHNTQLTDEVRAVFDRLLATDEQIKEMQELRGMMPAFESAQQAGMTPEEWSKYLDGDADATEKAMSALRSRSLRDVRWIVNARSRELSKISKGVAEKRKAVEAEVRAEVEQEPVYAVQRWMKTGVLPDGTETVGAKLSGKALKEMYGDDPASPRRYLPTNLIDAEGGLPPDTVAEMFGFQSGDQMVRAIVAAFPVDSEVQGRTDQRMLERYGDLATPEGKARAAEEAIHNEARARFIATELAAISKAQGPVRVMQRAAKMFAEQLVAKRKIKDLKPKQHLAAETRAAKRAEQAMKAGKTQDAIAAKRDHLLNFYAAQETTDALAEVERGLRYLDRVQRSETIDPEEREQIAAMLERFDLRKSVTGKELERRQTLADWVEAQREMGVEPNIPPELADELTRKHYREMPLADFRGLIDTIKQIEHYGRVKHKLLTAANAAEFAAARQEIIDSIVANAGDREADTRTSNTALGGTLEALKRFRASHIKAGMLARTMDGGKDGGKLWEYLIRAANKAGDTEVDMRAKATRELAALVNPLLKTGSMGGKGILIPEINRSMNRQARIAVALNTGNESNMQRVMGGEGWTAEQVEAITSTLTEQEWKFVQAVWDYFESYRPLIAEKEKRVNGVEPKWLEPAPREVQTADGKTVKLRGGYYPVKYDPRASERAEAHGEADAARQQMRAAYTSATTRRSFTKERADEVTGRPLLYSFDGIYNGVNEIIHDLSWHEFLIDANRLIRDPGISAAMRQKWGPEAHQQFKTWLRDVAQGEQGAANAGEAALGWIRQGVSISGLGFNVMTALIQPLGLTQSWVRIGPKYIARGVADFIGKKDATAEVHEKSSFMRNRAQTRLRELAEVAAQVKGRTKAREMLDTSAYWLMMRAQQVVDIPTWIGAYEKAITEGNDETRAIALADQAVIDSQGSGMRKDMAAIERGGEALKLFTVFYQFFNTAYNLGVTQTATQESRAKLAADYLMLFVVPVVLGALLKDALTPGDSGDDDEKKLAKKLIGEEIAYMMNLMVGVREVAGAAQVLTGTNQYGTDYSGPAGLRPVGDLYKLAKQTNQGEADAALRKAIINTSGQLLRLPAAQINRSITGAEALADGKTDNPAAVIFGYQEPK